MRADQEVKKEQAVASITRGDTAISYRDGRSSQQAAVNLMKNYEASLNRYKKMNLPKDKRE